MLNLRNGASEIAGRLGATEAAADDSVKEGARMIAAMIEQFAAAGVASKLDQETLELALAGVTAAVDGRRKYLELHRRLAALGRKLDLEPHALGDCDNYPTGLQADAPLRAVA